MSMDGSNDDTGGHYQAVSDDDFEKVTQRTR